MTMATPYERLLDKLNSPTAGTHYVTVVNTDLRAILAEYAAYRAALKLIGNEYATSGAAVIARSALTPPTGDRT